MGANQHFSILTGYILARLALAEIDVTYWIHTCLQTLDCNITYCGQGFFMKDKFRKKRYSKKNKHAQYK